MIQRIALGGVLAFAGVVLPGATLAAPATPDVVVHVVQAGENPWRIMRAMLRGPQFVEPLLRLNGITDPTSIPPGTRVKLQSHWLRLLPVKAEVLRASEGVEWRAGPTQAWAPLESGTTLAPGAWVRTPADGECTLAFARGTHVLVRPDTEVQLVRLEGARAAGVLAASLSVLRGSVENLVERQGAGGRFEIRTPAAVATVRGTAFRVASTPGQMQTAVDRGAVRLGNRFGARELPAGFRAAASAEGAPSAPAPLLGAPDLTALGPRITRFPAVLALPPLPGARAVRARWLLQGDPLVTVSEAPHERLILAGRGVPDGDHRLQVRWVDAEGFEGLEAQVPMRVHRLPDPPVYVQPTPGAVLSTEQPELEWGRSELREVHLQVSARADMSEPWVDVRLPNEGKARIPRSLELGPWYWRLASVDPTGESGPWGDTQKLVRAPSAPSGPPGLEGAGPGGQAKILRWPAVPNVRGYDVELTPVGAAEARPRVFSADDRAQLPLPDDLSSGDYAVRIRSVIDDGITGDWSPPQVVRVPSLWNPWILVPLLLPWLL